MTNVYKNYDRADLAFKKLDPGEGDIIVISFPDDINPEQMQAFAEDIQPEIPEGVSILCIRDGVTVDLIKESEMNKLGWYKFDTRTMN